MTAMVNLINSVGCKYLLPCGICDKTGSLCSQLEAPYTPTPDIPMISVYAAPSKPYPWNYEGISYEDGTTITSENTTGEKG